MKLPEGKMPTIGNVVRRLLPKGPRAREEREAEIQLRHPAEHMDYSGPPLWPPDVFAVAASLVGLSEAYTRPEVRGGLGIYTDLNEPRFIGDKWAKDPKDPTVVQWLTREWETLWSHEDDELRHHAEMPGWVPAAFRLLAAADEAASGMGFGGDSTFALAAEKFAAETNFTTWCLNVSADEACVQPKGRTPPVGCTLRTLSLHLALLPPKHVVTTRHVPTSQMPLRRGEQLGVLVVPFPYVLRTDDLRGTQITGQHWGTLDMTYSWAATPTPTEVADFVCALLDSAGAKADVVVFPEVALSEPQHKAVMDRLIDRGVRLMIAGVHSARTTPPRNLAVGVIQGSAETRPVTWEQSKHHRWRVERWQVRNYGLNLDENVSWWENIDISQRSVVTARFSEGATVACLVCEDLARVEPVQPALREMGASLIIALLMDGPQYQHRWSAKSATVFAEDPGSSVLAVTSLALVRRNQKHREHHEKTASPPIGVWQEPGGAAIEMPIAPDAHAVHFLVTIEEQKETTLDGRGDNGAAEVIRLVKPPAVGPFRSLIHPNAPPWAVPMYRTTDKE